MRALVALLVAGSAIAQQRPYGDLKQPYGNLKQVMRSVPYPNSNIIFEVQSKPPKNDMEWQTVENAAIAIEETAKLILQPGRLRSNGQPVPVQAADYIQYAQALVPAGGNHRAGAISSGKTAVNRRRRDAPWRRDIEN